MVWYGWGGADRSTVGYTDNMVYVDGINLPLGRAAANNQHPIVITTLEGWVRGRGASRGGVLRLEWSGTANFIGDTNWFTVPAAGSASPTGQIGGVDAFIANGGQARFVIDMDGSFYFARGGGGGPSRDLYGTSFDQTLAGSLQYVEAPSIPAWITASPDPGVAGRINLTWQGPDSDGGTGLRGYRIFYSTDQAALLAGFAQGSWDTGNGNSASFSGTVGTQYYFRIGARNWVTDLAGTTSHWNSGSTTAVAPGLPGAPTSFTATPSTTTLGRVSFTWTAPSLAPGGVNRYYIFAGTNVIGTSTTTSFTADGLAENVSVPFTVKAGNTFGDAINQQGPASNTSTATVPGRPSKPLNLSAVADPVTAGRVTLSWTAPTETAGGIARYSVYRSTGDFIGNTTSLTYQINGLTPGEAYRFYVVAYSTVSLAANTAGPASDIVGVTALGAPDMPTGLTVSPSTVVPGRLTISWTTVANVISYNIYNSAGTLLYATKGTTFKVDNLTPGVTYGYYVRAVNVAGLGPASTTVSGVPGANSSQPVANLPVSNSTNSTVNGTYNIVSLSATSLTFSRVASNIPFATVASGSVTNTTNTSLNGTFTVTTPSTTTLSYTAAGADINTNTIVTSGTVTDNTNAIFNGTRTVVTADNVAHTITYSLVGANVTSRAASGTVANTSNTQINGTGLVITAITPRTFSYAKTGTNVADSVATGIVTNNTNKYLFNGTYSVFSTPAYNTLTYLHASTDSHVPTPYTQATAILTPFGAAQRIDSPAVLRVKYRSGWAG